MALYYRLRSFYSREPLVLLIFFLFFSFLSLHAHSWPLIIVPKTDTDSVCAQHKKKYSVCSRTRFKRDMMHDCMNHIFFDATHPLEVQQNMPVQDLFFDARKNRSTKIRVLIAKADHAASACWEFTAPNGFMVSVEHNAGNKKKIVQVPMLTITIKRGLLLCNGKRLKHQLRIHPIDGHAACNSIIYDGDFVIVQHKQHAEHALNKNSFLCINEVELEDYVCAVLRTESWPGWPLEVNKAFAIACRSYAMFKMLEAQRNGRVYHVKNSNAHQTYRGKHDISVLKMAMQQTRGVVLGWKGAPILAMFDSCCGGVIPAYIEDFDFSKAPYLARTYPCHFCKQSSLYAWQVSYERTVFETLIKHNVPEITRISDVRVSKKDKAGLAREVTIKNARHAVTISGKRLYSIMKDIKSFHFDVHQKSGKILCIGRGFGHHIGLCQWGARDMVRDGWDYKSILRFYYPGAYFMHLM